MFVCEVSHCGFDSDHCVNECRSTELILKHNCQVSYHFANGELINRAEIDSGKFGNGMFLTRVANSFIDIDFCRSSRCQVLHFPINEFVLDHGQQFSYCIVDVLSRFVRCSIGMTQVGRAADVFINMFGCVGSVNGFGSEHALIIFETSRSDTEVKPELEIVVMAARN